MINNQGLLKSGYTKFSAPAKLNLFLKIINKRKDGYHNLQSIFQLIDLKDDVYIKIRYKDKKINIKNSSQLITPKNDLALKAANKTNSNLFSTLSMQSSTVTLAIKKFSYINILKKSI